ncbi:MAG: type IX secretion system plug protein domain-containing protein [Bacteroidota bacterium]
MKLQARFTAAINTPFNAAVFFFMLFLCFCMPFICRYGSASAQDGTYYSDKAMRYEDRIYEPGIRTVTLLPKSDSSTGFFDYPVMNLHDQQTKMVLEFDEWGDKYQNYYYKLIACNYDWSPSILLDMEFTESFNENIMDSYELSLNTRQPYMHYSATMPKVKLSGNYLIKVYRNRDQDDVVITRRYIVYENVFTVTPDIKFAIDPQRRFTDQQIDFNLYYGSTDLINPREMVKVAVRQNGRWDNAIKNLVPMFIREENKTLDYHFYNCENCFPGSNEWRLFDTRSVRFTGRGVETAKYDNNKAEVQLYPEGSRNKQAYNQQVDINGRFVIDNFETHNGATEADYVFTNFTLISPDAAGSDVYVYGQFSDWKTDKAYKMVPDSLIKTKYTLRTKLKQGFYAYMYALLKPGAAVPDLVTLEGSYNMTENRYDILVYFRPIGSRYDRLMGYANVDYFEQGK